MRGSSRSVVASLCRCKFVRGVGSRSEFRVAGVLVFISFCLADPFSVAQRVAQVHDQGVEVVGQAARGRVGTGMLEF